MNPRYGKNGQRRAISPIIATVLIIAVTLIASVAIGGFVFGIFRSEEHTSELQSRGQLVCRPLLEKKMKTRARSATCTLDQCCWRVPSMIRLPSASRVEYRSNSGILPPPSPYSQLEIIATHPMQAA